MLQSFRLCFLITLLFWIPSFASDSPPPPESIASLKQEIQALRATLNRLQSDNSYIVINTVHNRFQVRQKDRILQESVCATGSGKILLDPRSNTTWHFETPKGVRTIQRKVKDPIWSKPPWAFVEQGENPPVLPWAFNRLDPTTLGKYALKLGDGYEIHGTLYPHLLGRHITHGCIRLNDEDLKSAYTLTGLDNRVYIY